MPQNWAWSECYLQIMNVICGRSVSQGVRNDMISHWFRIKGLFNFLHNLQEIASHPINDSQQHQLPLFFYYYFLFIFYFLYSYIHI